MVFDRIAPPRNQVVGVCGCAVFTTKPVPLSTQKYLLMSVLLPRDLRLVEKKKKKARLSIKGSTAVRSNTSVNLRHTPWELVCTLPEREKWCNMIYIYNIDGFCGYDIV